jgi:predicted MFS family arabinose efflux permease
LALSPAIGPLIGGGLDQWFGWRANFMFLTVLGMFLIGYCFLRLPETLGKLGPIVPTTSSSMIKLAKRMVTDHTILYHVALVGISNGIIFSYYGEAPFLFIEVLRLTPTQYGFLGGLIAASTLIASAISRHLTHVNATQKSAAIGIGLVTAGSTGLAVAAHFGWMTPENPWVWITVLVPIVVTFIGIWVIVPFSLSHALAAYQTQLGGAGSIFGFLYYLAIAAFTVGMSLVHDSTPSAMPTYFVALSLLMAFVEVLARRRHREVVGTCPSPTPNVDFESVVAQAQKA